MTRIFFDARELYFLTQYIPVYRVLEARGIECHFVAYDNRSSHRSAIRAGFDALELPTIWVEDKQQGLDVYRREAPDWIVFGRSYGLTSQLPAATRTAQLYHGIGMKTDMWAPGLVNHDVRFVEGSYYSERLRGLFPDACQVDVGYPKIDPLLCAEEQRPRLDLEALGLDPKKKTLLYAPTHSPTSFPNMRDDWPAEFEGYNLIVKPHQLSYFSSKRQTHREKMDLWARSPNVHIAPIEAFDAAPYMNTADLMISDLSAVLFEFAATGKPVIWCDFLHFHWTRSGLLHHRRWKRVDRKIVKRFHDIAMHAKRYRDLKGIVQDALADPERGRSARRKLAEELVGPLDGRSAERVADYLLEHAGQPAVGRAASALAR